MRPLTKAPPAAANELPRIARRSKVPSSAPTLALASGCGQTVDYDVNSASEHDRLSMNATIIDEKEISADTNSLHPVDSDGIVGQLRSTTTSPAHPMSQCDRMTGGADAH